MTRSPADASEVLELTDSDVFRRIWKVADRRILRLKFTQLLI